MSNVYTQGICNDRAAILCDGYLITIGYAIKKLNQLSEDNEVQKYIKERRHILDNTDWGKDKPTGDRLFELDHLINELSPPRGISHKELEYIELVTQVAESMKKHGASKHPLKIKIDKLEAALGFYADESNNSRQPTNDGYRYSRVHYDKGAQAREALKELSK